jgi:hypothetical protein
MHLKKLLKTNALIIITLLLSFSAFAQAPNLLNYQGVARNAVGNPLPNQTMKLRLSIHDLLPSGAVVYSEIRQITTNLGGLFSVQIGSAGASSSTGTLGGVNWIVGNKFLQVELDPASNNNYIDIGTVQLVSVPYAFGAGSAATVKTNANLTGVVTSVGNATSIANGAITSDMIGTLNKSKVGLDLVNNTTDAAKPISTATQAALDNKLAIADSTNKYVTPAQLAAKTFDQTPITNAIAGKLAIADSTNGYVTPSQLAAKTFDQTPITNAIAGKLAIADSTTAYVTPTQLAAKTFDTTSLSDRINLKANITSVNTALALKANIASPTFTGTVTTGIINTGALSSTSVSAPTYASAPKTLSYTGTTINWNPAQGLNAAITLTQNSTLSFTAAPPVGSYGTIVLTQDGTGSRTITLPTIGSVTNKVLGSTSTSTVALSTTANSKDILNFYFDGTNCYWNVGQGYGDAASASSSTANLATGVTGTLAIANGGTGATTAAAALTNLGAAPVASPTFTGTVNTGVINSGALSATSVNTGTITATSITSPIYASTPQALTDGSTITWNPALGLNASVTLGGNRILSFTSTPIAGAYGTLVVTQDGTGNRTITLPTIANKVLGSTSTTTIALSTAANAKDILNFYYDGTNCFWNIGQGYGTAASSSSTTNLTTSVTGTLPVANGGTGATTLTGYVKGAGTATMTASATIPVADITGTLPVANGGTGATTLTGIIKGTGTSSLTAAVAGTDYLAPNGSAASLTNFPTLNQNTTGNAANVTGIVSVANGGTGTTTGSITGTTALSFAAGGSNQNVSILPSGTGSVGIGTNSPNSSAILDASSTTKGFLPPRMTYAQKMAIASPPQGLIIYCTNCGTNGEPEYYNGVAWVNMAGGAAASVPPPPLGSTYEGGKVFYIFQPGDEPSYVAGETHGLIAAPSDIPSNAYRIVVGCYGDYGTSTALGTGAANTTKLLACNDAVNAAKLVDALTDGGYSDWYLPSKDELNKLYLNRNLVGNFTDWIGWYWSSSEFYLAPASHAWFQRFSDGSQDGEGKGYQKGIRAIRSF